MTDERIPDEQLKILDNELKRLHLILLDPNATNDIKMWAAKQIEVIQNDLRQPKSTNKAQQ